MKMNFKYLMFAAALAVGFSSCSSEEGDYPAPQTDGTKTSFTFSLGGPATYSDPDGLAADYDLEFKSVDIYVYTGDGTLETHVQRNKTADFEQDATQENVWHLTRRIGITTGEKSIFVGLNLPADIAANIRQNGPESVNSIVNISDLKTNDGIAMFNKDVVKKTFTDVEATNKVVVPVSRLLAKIIFMEKNTGTYTVQNGSGDTAEDVFFTVGNVNNKFFPLPHASFEDPNFAIADMTTTFFHPTGAVDYREAAKSKAAFNDEDSVVYFTENTITDGIVTQGSATYGIVRVKYTPAVVYKADGTTPGTLDPINGTFYLANINDKDILFESEAAAITAVSAGGGNADDICKYDKGLAYYPVFLKDARTAAGASKYSVYRNTAYQVTIDKIYGLGSHTDQPNDKPKGIIIPEEPIESETTMSVTIEILDWVPADPQETDLNGR